MEILFLLWPVAGWCCAYFSTPKWMMNDGAFWVMLFVCGGIVGPFGFFWFFGSTSRRGERSRK